MKTILASNVARLALVQALKIISRHCAHDSLFAKYAATNFVGNVVVGLPPPVTIVWFSDVSCPKLVALMSP